MQKQNHVVSVNYLRDLGLLSRAASDTRASNEVSLYDFSVSPRLEFMIVVALSFVAPKLAWIKDLNWVFSAILSLWCMARHLRRLVTYTIHHGVAISLANLQKVFFF